MAGIGIVDMGSLARDFGRAMRQVGSAMSACGRALTASMSQCGGGFAACSRSIQKMGNDCSRSLLKASRVGYYRFGQYTYPLERFDQAPGEGDRIEGEEQALPKTPPQLSDLSEIERFVHIFPTFVLPISALLSVSFIPLIGNSLQVAPKAFRSMVNLTSPWKYNVRRTLANRDRSWYRYVYATPGLIIGGGLGLAFAAVMGSIRILFELLKHFMQKTLAAISGVIYVSRSVIGNSVKTFGRIFQKAVNFTLPRHKQLNLFESQIDLRDANDKYGAGWIGLVLGLPVGLVFSAALGLTRVGFELGEHLFYKTVGAFAGTWQVLKYTVLQNANSFWRAYSSLANKVLPAGCLLPVLAEDNRSKADKYGIGGVGFILGGALGAISALVTGSCRIAYESITHFLWKTVAAGAGFLYVGRHLLLNSAESFFRVFNTLVSFAAPKKREFFPNEPDSRSYLQRYGAGFIGFALGGAAGILVAASVGIFRVGFALLGHFTLKTIAAISGIVHVSIISLRGLGYFLKHNADSFINTFVRAANLTLPKDLNFTNREDSRPPAQKFGIGLAGTLLGCSVGLAFATFAGVYRVVIQLAMHLLSKTVAATVGAYVVSESATKHMGGFFKVFALNNLLSCRNIFVSVLNLSLPDNLKIPARFSLKPDDRSNKEIFGIGGVGFMLGGSFGLAASAVIGSVNIVIELVSHLGLKAVGAVVGTIGVAQSIYRNTKKSFYRTFASIANLTLWKKYEFNLENPDTRPAYKKYGIGLLGVVAGAGFGILWAGLVGVARISNQAVSHFGMKFVGAVTGMLTVSKEVIVQTAKSFARTFVDAFNIIYPWKWNFANPDERSNQQKYGVGILGFVAGASFGLVTATLARTMRIIFEGTSHFCLKLMAAGAGVVYVTGRVAKHSFVSLIRTFADGWNLGSPYKINFAETDRRDPSRKYGIGLFGFMLGGAFGLAAAACWGVGRVIVTGVTHLGNKFVGAITGICKVLMTFGSHNLHSFARTFVATANLGFVNSYRPFAHPDTRSNGEKYGIGFLGFILGGSTGLLISAIAGIGRIGANLIGHVWSKSKAAMLGIWHVSVETAKLTGQFFKHNYLSFKALSGSLINLAFYYDYFHGLAGDRRTSNQKAVGILGYALAMPFAVFVLRFPLAVALGVAASPLVAALKTLYRGLYYAVEGIKYCSGSSKPPVGFVISDKEGVRQAFKNVVSSLNKMGEFEPGMYIEPNGNGLENWGLFAKKCFMFNTKTRTEATADILWDEYEKRSNISEGGYGVDFFDEKKSTDFDRVKNKIIRDETGGLIGYFSTKSQTDEAKEEIESAADLIRSYINEHKMHPYLRYAVVNPIVREPALSYSQAFFGKPRPLPSAPPEENPAPSAPMQEFPDPSAPDLEYKRA